MMHNDAEGTDGVLGEPCMAKLLKYEINYQLCIICQKETTEPLIGKPQNQEKLLKRITERAIRGEKQYVHLQEKFRRTSADDLITNSASWHGRCYQVTARSDTLHPIVTRYNSNVPSRRTKRQPSHSATDSCDTPIFTRSQTVPFSESVCVFCNTHETKRHPLHTLSEGTTYEFLLKAASTTDNPALSTKFCNSSSNMPLGDGPARGIRYHKKCWASNIFNNNRKQCDESDDTEEEITTDSAEVRFLGNVENNLSNGKMFTVATLTDVYNKITNVDDVSNPQMNGKRVKKILKENISDVDFHPAKRRSESNRITVKGIRNKAIINLEENDDSQISQDIILRKAAQILRNEIQKCGKWSFTGSLTNIPEANVPTRLTDFCRCLLLGKQKLSTEPKDARVKRHVSQLAQTAISLLISDRQARNTATQTYYQTTEMPHQLALALLLRQKIRCKSIVNTLHEFGVCANYHRILKVEDQIAKTVLRRMITDRDIYVPKNLISGRHTFFAIDNCDFDESTPDGKRTTHATVIALYQRCHAGDQPPPLCLEEEAESDDVQLPDTITPLLTCTAPTAPRNPETSSFTLSQCDTTDETFISDIAWLTARAIAIRSTTSSDEEYGAMASPAIKTVPTWSGYNSLLNDVLPTTRVNTYPLIAAPAHEYNTLLTVLILAQNINIQVVGQINRKTVISLDMGLYVPAKKLQMSRDDLNSIILRPGELHVVMAQLRTIGAFIEGSGIDCIWSDSDTYGPCVIKQILESRHVHRAIEAHTVTLQAFFALYLASISEQKEVSRNLTVLVQDLIDDCANKNSIQVRQCHTRIMDVARSSNLAKTTTTSDSEPPLSCVLKQYMTMVLEMLSFLIAVRTADWDGHLRCLESFLKYFFAHDRLVYARMLPLYLSDMNAVKETSPEIHNELSTGNWVVNKNEHASFCAIGADHALEHINRSMKVAGGLVGITLNAKARLKFFAIQPEMARLSDEAERIAGRKTEKQTTHHQLCSSIINRHDTNAKKLLKRMEYYANPFDSNIKDLCHITTSAIVPDDVKIDLCTHDTIGREMLNTFVSERLINKTTNFWSPMKKRCLHTWKSLAKKAKIKLENTVVELKEDRTLFARMLVVTKSRPDMSLSSIIGEHEMSVVPRSLFAADGSMLHCKSKCALMGIIETLTNEMIAKEDSRSADNTGITASEQPRYTVAIVDAMADVQSIKKGENVKTVNDLARQFTNSFFLKYNQYDEIHAVFDRYDISKSLKQDTRINRLGGESSVVYRITDNTNISSVPLHRLLSANKTKHELSGYLSEHILKDAEIKHRNVVVSWSNKCQSSHRDVSHLASEQEEADTKIILHAVEASERGATTIAIHSPDTDVFVLAVRRYPMMCDDANFVTGTGARKRTISLKSVYYAIGAQKAATLPAFHALTGADVTGSFAGKGKLTFWKEFTAAPDHVVSALCDLGTTSQLTETTREAIEEFVCRSYSDAKSKRVFTVSALRWALFATNQSVSERLPPTSAALYQATLRALYQAMVWCNDVTANPDIPPPDGYGWKTDGLRYIPVMTTQLPAPLSVIEFVKCGCKGKCVDNRCSCHKAKLNCTDLCGCSSEVEICENVEPGTPIFEDEDDAEL